MKEDGFDQFGFYILATLYLFMGIGSIISTAVIHKLGSKVCLLIGGLGNFQWILCSVLVTHQKSMEETGSNILSKELVKLFMFGSTIINGLTVGILWSCSNNFIAHCATDENKGFIFSYYWTFYMTSQILGNLIAALTLGSFSQTTFFIIMGIIALLGTIVLAFI